MWREDGRTLLMRAMKLKGRDKGSISLRVLEGLLGNDDAMSASW